MLPFVEDLLKTRKLDDPKGMEWKTMDFPLLNGRE